MTTNEGMIGTAENAKTVAVVEVNAETDFVVKNDRFKKFVEDIASEIAATQPSSVESFLKQKYSKDRIYHNRSIPRDGYSNYW